jgi:ATP-dependent Clp protease ATP-binding subunit ClpX
MKEKNEKIPDPKTIEKEISEFLTKKFGSQVKIKPSMVMPHEVEIQTEEVGSPEPKRIDFNLKPEDLVSYLDQYIIKQDNAKAILATKICTHFNRIKYAEAASDDAAELVGSIKNNILMIGPTGVGKTYMIKLIAKKIGVPFVKGDATKFSETGYVGGDVEDLVRDLVKQANDDTKLAQYGIIYIDEIDKIASSRNMIGADVSRTGVQRALLKPMEETQVDLKAPHDPISIIQEIERFRKTGKRDKTVVNTKNILFIVSGAFVDLAPIIKKRMTAQGIGFGAQLKGSQDPFDILRHVKAEDLIEFGFESEFVGRLPVLAVFEKLTEDDLFQILRNPNNPIILGKKLDFAAYGIEIKFMDKVLRELARQAFEDNTGARGLVSAVERTLLTFEKALPSAEIKKFPATCSIIKDPVKSIKNLIESPGNDQLNETFEKLVCEEKEWIKEYVKANKRNLSEKYHLTLTGSRIDIIANYYVKHVMDIGNVIKRIKSYYDDIKKIELYFFKNRGINLVMEEDAIDFIIEECVNAVIELKDFYHRLTTDFEYGLKLVAEKTGRNRFFITRSALLDPESFIRNLLKDTPANSANI